MIMHYFDADDDIEQVPDSGQNSPTSPAKLPTPDNRNYGEPVNLEIVESIFLQQKREIMQKFKPIDISFMKHVILDNPMGQSEITKLLQFQSRWFPKESLSTFKSGKKLLDAVDELQLSVDYELRNISFKEIAISLPPEFKLLAKRYYQTMDSNVYIRPMRKVIQTTLQDRSLDSHFQYKFKRQIDSQNNRLYSEAWSSDRCETLQNMLPDGATALLLTIGSDAAIATKLGKKSFHPFHLDFANLNKGYRKILSNRSRQLLFYMPKIHKNSNSESKSPAWLLAFKRAFFHAVLRTALSDIEDWIREGVELESPDGRIRWYFPVLMHVNGDYPELCMLSLTVAGKSAPMTCCFVPEDHLCDCGDPCGKFYDLKTTKKMKELIQQGNEINAKTSRQNFFKAYGIVEHIQNAFYALGPTFCIHEAITPDKLHVNESGVFAHHLWLFIKANIEKEYPENGLDLLDSRFVILSKFPAKFPGIKTFKNGVTLHSRLTRDDYQAIMKSLLLCAVDLFNEQQLECFKTFNDLVMTISSTAFTDTDLDAMQQKFVQFEQQIKCFLANSKVQSKLCFPKLHTFGQFAHLIRKLGAPDGYGTEAVEASHVNDVVKAYLASNRKNAEEQMMRFVARQDKMIILSRVFGWAENTQKIGIGLQHKLVKVMHMSFFHILDKSSDLQYSGIKAKISKHLELATNKAVFYRTVKITDHDEDGIPAIQHLRTGPTYMHCCLYDVGTGNGIKGSNWALGGLVALFRRRQILIVSSCAWDQSPGSPLESLGSTPSFALCAWDQSLGSPLESLGSTPSFALCAWDQSLGSPLESLGSTPSFALCAWDQSLGSPLESLGSTPSFALCAWDQSLGSQLLAEIQFHTVYVQKSQLI
ncbi:hypothetical protein BDR26DRAFT_1004946 [Obelidium mucronatum]|nr:hypothetical protein BDR26DRAFT_1004946 [Obelidium mucronatum]